ncbi:MAG: NfeD family protein [Eubacterium sp.]|nr:NfeD family protein [Eubacterium sp.]
MLTIFWLILVAVMLVVEIFTMGLTTIWFSLGAVAAAIAAGLGAPLWVQILLFTVVSVVIMILVRPFALKVMDRNRTKTNIDEVIGQQAEVIEPIDNQKEQGKVRFRGVEWMARSVDGSTVAAGDVVTVEEVSGVKLLVKKL